MHVCNSCCARHNGSTGKHIKSSYLFYFVRLLVWKYEYSYLRITFFFSMFPGQKYVQKTYNVSSLILKGPSVFLTIWKIYSYQCYIKKYILCLIHVDRWLTLYLPWFLFSPSVRELSGGLSTFNGRFLIFTSAHERACNRPLTPFEV